VQMLLVAFSLRMCCSRVPTRAQAGGHANPSRHQQAGPASGVEGLARGEISRNAGRRSLAEPRIVAHCRPPVRSEFTGRLKHREAQQIRRDGTSAPAACASLTNVW